MASVVTFEPDSDHQFVTRDTDSHVPLVHESNTAKHLLLDNAFVRTDVVSDSTC